MNLVKQRDQWKQVFTNGEKPFFPAFDDYKKNRGSEHFRLNSSMEEFFEYVLFLEERLNDSRRAKRDIESTEGGVFLSTYG